MLGPGPSLRARGALGHGAAVALLQHRSPPRREPSCRATTGRELSSSRSVPSAATLLPGSPVGAQPCLSPSLVPLLLPGPSSDLSCLPSPLPSLLATSTRAHQSDPSCLPVLSFIIHFESELIRGIKGCFSLSSRALLSQPRPGLAVHSSYHRAQRPVSGDGEPSRSTSPLHGPCVVALIAQEMVLSSWNRLMMGPRWLTLSLGCCLALSHLRSESPAAVNPWEITASSSSFYADTSAFALALQRGDRCV